MSRTRPRSVKGPKSKCCSLGPGLQPPQQDSTWLFICSLVPLVGLQFLVLSKIHRMVTLSATVFVVPRSLPTRIEPVVRGVGSVPRAAVCPWYRTHQPPLQK